MPAGKAPPRKRAVEGVAGEVCRDPYRRDVAFRAVLELCSLMSGSSALSTTHPRRTRSRCSWRRGCCGPEEFLSERGLSVVYYEELDPWVVGDQLRPSRVTHNSVPPRCRTAWPLIQHAVAGNSGCRPEPEPGRDSRVTGHPTRLAIERALVRAGIFVGASTRGVESQKWCDRRNGAVTWLCLGHTRIVR
jgi:hypothetical protein